MLSENAKKVVARYLRKDKDGKPIETVDEMFRRVASHIAKAEKESEREFVSNKFLEILSNLKFIPNSPTFSGAGTPLGQLAACFVLPIQDDMGKKRSGIFQTLRDAALIQQTGGGNGFSFSRLRPKNTRVKTSMGMATGPVGFIRVYNSAFEEIAQGGTRRGANMAVLRVDHPDIEEFIIMKDKEGDITNFNISVGITDDFMRAVESDEMWELKFPDVFSPKYNDFDGTLEEAAQAGIPIKTYKTVRARELFDKIVRQAHKNGEPGLLFLDRAQRDNPVPLMGRYEATNPCLTNDTWVITPSGPRRIRDIKGKKPYLLLNSRFCRSSGFFCTGHKEVIKIVTQNGYEIKLTPNHLVMVLNSEDKNWKEAGAIVPGEWVVLSNHGHAVWGGNGKFEDGLIARLMEDVSKNADNAVYVNTSYPNTLFKILEKIGINTKRQKNDVLITLSKKLGFKAVDLETIEKSSYSMYMGYITANLLIDSTHKNATIRITGKPERIVVLHRMLLRVGVISRLHKNTIIIDETFARFLVTKLRDFVDDKIIKDIYPYNVSPLNDSECVYIDRVEKIVYLDGLYPVYDTSVPYYNAFSANGFYVHNCGEQFLLPYENCCLGSINLIKHVDTERKKINFEELKETIYWAVRFLDNVITVNAYVPSIPELKDAAERSRRIGLGIMGLADVLYVLGYPYDSDEGRYIAALIMEYIRYHAMLSSVELAKERGPFPIITGSIYDPQNMTWKPPRYPEWLKVNEDLGLKIERPPLSWDILIEQIKTYGIRNATTLTVAPTGTIATLAGVEGYGCEPVFALAYTRKVVESDGVIELNYISPIFQRAIDSIEHFSPDEKKSILQQVSQTGSCKNVAILPESIKRVFQVAQDVSVDGHIKMQAALQVFTDASISKTINLPPDATVEDVYEAFVKAWKLGCKGITVYVAKSRNYEVLSVPTSGDQPSNISQTKTSGSTVAALGIKTRPVKLNGCTYRTQSPLGALYVTINETEDGPFEVFLNIGKAGSDITALSEAIGRLISMILRLPSPMQSTEKIEHIVQQLIGIGSGRSIGYGHNKILSLPDAIARTLRMYNEERMALKVEMKDTNIQAQQEQAQVEYDYTRYFIKDICPACGQATMVNSEGCVRCYTCGHSEC